MRQLNRLSVVAALLLPAILAATAEAQQGKPIGNWGNLNQFVAGTEIRVTLAGRTLRGFLQRVTPESLAINATTSQETLSRQDIRRVAVKKSGHRGRNTLIGLGMGIGVGLALGAAQNGPGSTVAAVYSSMGAIGGTVIGVALPTGGWHDVYRAP